MLSKHPPTPKAMKGKKSDIAKQMPIDDKDKLIEECQRLQDKIDQHNQRERLASATIEELQKIVQREQEARKRLEEQQNPSRTKLDAVLYEESAKQRTEMLKAHIQDLIQRKHPTHPHVYVPMQIHISYGQHEVVTDHRQRTWLRGKDIRTFRLVCIKHPIHFEESTIASSPLPSSTIRYFNMRDDNGDASLTPWSLFADNNFIVPEDIANIERCTIYAQKMLPANQHENDRDALSLDNGLEGLFHEHNGSYVFDENMVESEAIWGRMHCTEDNVLHPDLDWLPYELTRREAMAIYDVQEAENILNDV